MKRLLSTLLAAIGIVAVLAVAAVVYVTTFLDPEDLKPRLEAVVQEQTGLSLALEGPIAWSFYPRLGVSVEQAQAWLPAQAAGEDPAFMAFQRAEVSLGVASLLRGEVAIDGMTLNGLRLNLARDEQGRGNWEPLVERLAAPDQEAGAPRPEDASSAPVPGDGGGLAVAFNIASVEVRDGEVNYRDRAGDRSLRLKGLSVSGRNVNPRNPFPLQSSFQVLGYDTSTGLDDTVPRLASDVELDGRLTLALAERRYTLEAFSLATSNRLPGVEPAQDLALEGGRLVVDMAERRLGLEPATLEATLVHPVLGESPLPLTLALAMEADLAEGVARLRDLELTGEHGLRLSGNLNLAGLGEAPRYDGQLRLAPLSLRPWLERFDRLPATTDPEALTDVALTSPLEGNLDRVALTGLTLLLDGSTFTGRLDAGLGGERLEAELQGDSLDLDAYLPPGQGEAEASAGLALPGVARAFAQDEPQPLPLAWLRPLALDAELRLSRLRLAGLDATDVTLALAGSDGRHRLETLEAAFYEGSLAVQGELDLTGEPAAWRLAPRLERVRVDALLEALGEGDEKAPLRGRAFVEGELTTRGNAWPEMRRGLGGRLATRLDDGAILEVNVSRELCTAVATLEGEQPQRDWAPDTRFDRAEATLVFREGVMESDDLTITLPGIDMGGEGWLDLTSRRFDLRGAARVVDTADLACEVNPRLERLPFPVRCEGNLDGDSAEWCRFDREAFQGAIGEALRQELQQRAGEEVEERLGGALDKLEERIGGEAGGELRDALRGLFE
ncbi:AsmA protein [Halomonas shengliensis]|uniref:AsmA protein n=1 Tax=Halomonas shengliensis TaxID=419597 RepID=A0A1H0K7W6_9GAMM|nr:AsmA family protein [Halomonas shengliensis]SDO51791.1 AsmA protein [Halomonas shengliensis]